MEDIRAILKAAGWSDDTIQAFFDPNVTVINPVPTSAYTSNAFSEEYDDMNLPKRIDSTSLVICCSQEE